MITLHDGLLNLTKPAIASAVFETVHRARLVKLTHKEFN